MEKNFENWHVLKAKLHESPYNVFFHEREIWFCSLGLNIGFEQDGKNEYFERPIVIIKKFNQQIFWGIPLTSQEKTGKYYFPYEYQEKRYYVILSQLRLFDGKRLVRKVTVMPKGIFKTLKLSLKNFL